MQVNKDNVAKLLNAQISAMFAVWREANIPEAALDAIIEQNKEGLEQVISYLKTSDMTDSQRALIANILSWAINTIGLAAELGMVLELNKTDEGKLPPFKKTA